VRGVDRGRRRGGPEPRLIGTTLEAHRARARWSVGGAALVSRRGAPRPASDGRPPGARRAPGLPVQPARPQPGAPPSHARGPRPPVARAPPSLSARARPLWLALARRRVAAALSLLSAGPLPRAAHGAHFPAQPCRHAPAAGGPRGRRRPALRSQARPAPAAAV